MACITERPNKNGPASWQAVIRIKGARKIVRSFPSKQAAEEFAAETEGDIRAGQGDELSPRCAAKDFIELSQAELRSVIRMFLNSDKCCVHNKRMAPTVLSNIGDIKVGDIRRSWIKAYLTRMKAKRTHSRNHYAWATLNGHVHFMGQAIKWRANELDIAAPHFPHSKDLLPKGWQTKRERRLSNEEEAALMARLGSIKSHSRQHWPSLVGLAIETGARLQELVLAEWGEVDMPRRLWTIPARHTKGKRQRAVPLSSAAMAIMGQLQSKAQGTEARIFHRLSTPSIAATCFHRYSVGAGLVDFRFHDLRHEAISRMVLYKRKLSIFEIMKIVGHSSVEMLNRYANLRGDELVDRMD